MGHPAVALQGLAGAGLGFLPFNLLGPLIGDGGALMFGFILATLSIRGTTGIEDSVFIACRSWPSASGAEALLSFARRVLDRRHPSKAIPTTSITGLSSSSLAREACSPRSTAFRALRPGGIGNALRQLLRGRGGHSPVWLCWWR
jgi:UDP-N-acetylmuramyl pentapeptide phosphotransferase/UDP-N-acetylglucosamine-1-phosphate transferase